MCACMFASNKELVGESVCVFWVSGEHGGGVCGVGIASVFRRGFLWGECGRWEERRVAVGGVTLPQSGTVRWAGTKRLGGRWLDWPGPAWPWPTDLPNPGHCKGSDKRISCSVHVPESSYAATETICWLIHTKIQFIHYKNTTWQ